MPRKIDGFWSATPVQTVAQKRAFYIRMQICLTQDEYCKKRQPYYVRFLTRACKTVHIPIDKYCYVRDSVLEVMFYYDEPDAFPVQTPLVCFDQSDIGDDEEDACNSEPMELYTKLCLRAAVVRNKLEALFPECRLVDVGFMENELMLFLRLRGNFMVAVSSESSVPIFTWDRRCLTPLDKAKPKLGQGFKLAMPNLDGTANVFWYERDRVQLFVSVKKVVEYADRHLYSDGETRLGRHLRSADIIGASDILRAQVYHLSCAFPHLKVATFSRVAHTIRVYVDLQWRCEVRWLQTFDRCFVLNLHPQVNLNINGTWRVVCMDPDPVIGSANRAYLDKFEADVNHALTVTRHFILTGRVCACCAATSPSKMRRCPCDKGAYYCSRDCQRTHWKDHKVVCGLRSSV